MKKFFTLLIVSFLIQPVFADNKEVILDESITPKPRSLIQRPIAFVDDESFTLSIQFPTQDNNYRISVTDNNGIELAQYQGLTIPNLQVFQLPILEAGFYKITISNISNSFTGNFKI